MMDERRLAIVLVLIALTYAGTTRASDEGERQTSLTVGVARPLSARFDAQIRLGSRFSGGLIVGDGLAQLMGAQGRVFLLGDFEHGMPISWEVLRLSSSMSCFVQEAQPSCFEPQPDEINSSLLVGYKKVFPIGLTLDALTGVTYVLVSRVGTTRTFGGSSYFALNLGVGWSF